MAKFDNLSCPIDKEILSYKERSLVCSNGHSFDLAKTGYVNLLPVQNKRSKDPGDSKEMVRARQQFLNEEYYSPILTAILSSWPKDNLKDSIRILDAGCGEGYYLDWLTKMLSEQGMTADSVGIDISKWAITAASKRNKQISWLVASNAHLPVPDRRFDAVLCLFGFPVFTEFSRVLEESGYVLLVESGEDHLIELRRILYPSIHAFQETHQGGIQGFELSHQSSETFTFTLDSQEAIQNLLSMTPHIHKASYEGKEAVKKLTSLHLTADISLRWYRKLKE